MKTSRIFNIIVLLSCCFLLGCKDDTYDVDLNNDSKIGIVGEVSNHDIRIGVYRAGNLTTGKGYQFINDAVVKIEKESKPFADLQQVDDRYYTSLKPLMLESNTEYRLNYKVADDSFYSSIVLPDSFVLDYKYNFPDVSIYLSPLSASSKTNYVIELFRNQYPNKDVPVFFYSEDVGSDNFIYNEITQPYSKLFFCNLSEPKRIDLTIPNESRNESFFLVVRSVPTLYYRYLYESEIQKSSKGLLVDLKSNINGGALGFVGSAFYRKVSLK